MHCTAPLLHSTNAIHLDTCTHYCTRTSVPPRHSTRSAQVTSHSTAQHRTAQWHLTAIGFGWIPAPALHCTARARQHHHTHFTSTWPLDHHIICTIIIPSTHHRTPQSDSSEHLTTSPHRLQDRTSHASLTHRCSPHSFSLALTKHAKAFPPGPSPRDLVK